MAKKKASAMSALEKQLRTIQQKNHELGGMTGVGLKVRHASLLFSEAEAADLDLKTIRQVGLAGIQALQRETGEESFWLSMEMELFPFDGSMVEQYDRSLKTRTENEQIDEMVMRTCRRLAPHYSRTGAHQVMEWLIRAYRVHEMNIEAVMACILPWHETPFFVRTVQNIFFQDGDKWGFLFEKVKRDASPITREFLAKRALVDPAVLQTAFYAMQWLCHQGVPCPRYCSFWLEVSLSMVSLMKPDPKHLYALLPMCESAARSRPHEHLQIGGYVLFAALMQKYREGLENSEEMIGAFMTRAKAMATTESRRYLLQIEDILI